MAEIASIIKYEGDNSTFVWKHPCEDFNSLTQLIVHESQEAIFYMNGQALDLFGPGRYTLETQNTPVSSKLLNRATDGETPFHCEVYFINKTVQMAIKWGEGQMRFIEPTMGLPVEIGAHGELNLMVCDSRKLLVKLIGNMSGIAWSTPEHSFAATGPKAGGDNGFAKDIESSFRPLISNAVKTSLPAAIKANNISLVEIDENLDKLSEALRQSINPGLMEYGLMIPQLYVRGIALPENDPNFKRMKEYHAMSFRTRMMEADVAMAAATADTEAKIKEARLAADARFAKTKAETDAEIAVAQTEAEAKHRLAQTEAEAKLRMAQAQADADVTVAQRRNLLEQELTQSEQEKMEAERNIFKAKAAADAAKFEAEKNLTMAQAEAEAKRLSGLADADTMRAMGYTQRDVIQADVQKAYAESLGQIGSNGGAIAGGGLTGGIAGDVVGLGVSLAAAGQISSQVGDMMRSFNAPASAAFGGAVGATCKKCGAPMPANAKFCPECGEKNMPETANTVVCPACGQTVTAGKFCPECGHKFVTACPKCGASVTGSKFCPECGEKL